MPAGGAMLSARTSQGVSEQGAGRVHGAAVDVRVCQEQRIEMSDDRRGPHRRAENTRSDRPNRSQSGRPESGRSEYGRPQSDRPGRGGRPSDTRGTVRRDEPALPDDVTPQDLDGEVRRDLKTLDRTNADAVARTW